MANTITKKTEQKLRVNQHVLDSLEKAEADISTLVNQQPSLDDRFLKLRRS